MVAAVKEPACPTFPNPGAETSIPWTEYGLLLVLASVWGASYTFIKIGVETIPPITLIAARTLIAGAVLLAVIRWRGLAMPKGRQLERFVFQACLNSVVPFTLIAAAERSIDAGLATILNATSPIFTFLLTALITRHEPVDRAQTVRRRRRHRRHLPHRSAPRRLAGSAIGLWRSLRSSLATICYAGAAISAAASRASTRCCPPPARCCAAPRCCCPLSLVVDRPVDAVAIDGVDPGLARPSVFSTALAFTIYFRLMHTLGSVGTTSQAYLRVPIGVGIGVLALGETVASTAAAGLVCVVVGVAAMTISGTEAPGDPPSLTAAPAER